MSSPSSGTQKVVSQTNPPAAVAPYLGPAAQAAQGLYQSGGPQVNPGRTVANLSPETQQGWAATAARATNGSPLTSAAQNWARGTLDGSSGTYGQLGNSVWSQVRPNVDSAFSGAGRYGSDAHAEALSRGFTEGIAPSFASMQGTAAGLANPLANQDYTDTAALTGVGTARDQYGQALVTDANNRFNAQQQRPYDNMNWYTSQLYGNPYSSTTQKTPVYQPGVAQQVTGGLLGALGAAGSFFGA